MNKKITVNDLHGFSNHVQTGTILSCSYFQEVSQCFSFHLCVNVQVLSATSVKMICKMLSINVFVAIKTVNETLHMHLFLPHNITKF